MENPVPLYVKQYLPYLSLSGRCLCRLYCLPCPLVSQNLCRSLEYFPGPYVYRICLFLPFLRFLVARLPYGSSCLPIFYCVKNRRLESSCVYFYILCIYIFISFSRGKPSPRFQGRRTAPFQAPCLPSFCLCKNSQMFPVYSKTFAYITIVPCGSLVRYPFVIILQCLHTSRIPSHRESSHFQLCTNTLPFPLFSAFHCSNLQLLICLRY